MTQQDRAARVAAIRDAAIVRTHVNVRALHDRLPDGRHRVRLFDQVARQMREWTGKTLKAAIAAATEAIRP